MKKAYFAIPALAAVALFGASAASAYGGPGGHMFFNADPSIMASRFEEQMTQQASLLGVSVDEMKNDWAAGKSLIDIAKEKGLSQADVQAKMQAARTAQMKQQLQNLVAQGKITQAQADARLKFITDNGDKKHEKGFGRFKMEHSKTK
ncbi:MAG: hypothetical protein NT034_01475 [Candidatus Magasanikbacteria bacterium]|nr:hypothetical protein [Candidatus Magasanikbacteria bacterium]